MLYDFWYLAPWNVDKNEEQSRFHIFQNIFTPESPKISVHRKINSFNPTRNGPLVSGITWCAPRLRNRNKYSGSFLVYIAMLA